MEPKCRDYHKQNRRGESNTGKYQKGRKATDGDCRRKSGGHFKRRLDDKEEKL